MFQLFVSLGSVFSSVNNNTILLLWLHLFWLDLGTKSTWLGLGKVLVFFCFQNTRFGHPKHSWRISEITFKTLVSHLQL